MSASSRDVPHAHRTDQRIERHPDPVLQPVTPARQHDLRAGRLLDVKSGQMLTNQAILIEGGKIISVGPASQAKVAPNTITIDLTNATVLPGLIDAHTHLTLDLGSTGYTGLGISPPREALIGARNARVTLEAGFTTVRNVGARGYSDIALRDAINAGDVPHARGPQFLFVTKPAAPVHQCKSFPICTE